MDKVLRVNVTPAKSGTERKNAIVGSHEVPKSTKGKRKASGQSKASVRWQDEKTSKKVNALGFFYDESRIISEVRENFSKEQIQAYKEAFRLFDKDGNGVISIPEVRTVLMSMGQDPKEEHIREMFERHDQDGSGNIDFLEFIKIVSMIQEEEADEDELIDVFRVIDYDGDGYISKADLRQVVVALRTRLSNSDLEEMIAVADKDGDGMITFEEFAKIVMSKY